MILFYNSKLEFLESQAEISYSYNKKAGKEGGGKVEVLNAPSHDAIYIILLDNEGGGKEYATQILREDNNIKYITSGYIESFNSQKSGVIQISFKTFEGIFANLRLPRYWHNYENWKLAPALMDLLFQVIPTYYTSKAELFNGRDHIIGRYNIEYENIENADLTLAFDRSKQQKDNTYYYCTEGHVIYLLDFGNEKTQVKYTIKNSGTHVYNATRVLRYSGQEGAKTFIYWRAIESDYPGFTDFADDDNDNIYFAVRRRLKKTPLLYFRKDEKDYAERRGVALPSNKRFVALELLMRYKKPDYNNDFNTQEINKSTDEKKDIVKRTVRGFTPILHGFEAIKRRAINPLENAEIEVAFPEINDIKINNLPLENMSLLDAMQKLKETYKFDVAFDLRLKNRNLTPTFFISIFRREELGTASYYGVDRRFDAPSLLRENKDVITHNNFNIKEHKKQLKPPYVLFVEGDGSPFDALHLTFLVSYILKDGREAHQIQIVRNAYFSVNNGILEATNLKDNIIENIPTTPLLKEERIEFKDVKTIEELIKKSVEHINYKEKKADTFEVDVFNPSRLYDKVRVLSGSNKAIYDALVLEEKINKKDNRLNKSIALDGSFFNPFDVFFKSKIISPLAFYPATPTSFEITSHKNILNISWDCLSVYDDFTILIRRCDKRPTFGFQEERAEKDISIFTKGDYWVKKEDEQMWDNYIEPVTPTMPPPPPPPSHTTGYNISAKNEKDENEKDENEKAEVSRFLSLLKNIENKKAVNIKNAQIRATGNLDAKRYPIQYITTKNKSIEVTSLGAGLLYEIAVASNLDGNKSNYCVSIFVKMKAQNKYVKHVNSLDGLQGEDGDIVFFLDNERRKADYIHERFNIFNWTNSHPLLFNSLSHFLDSNSNYIKIYNDLSDVEKYGVLAPYGLYYTWQLGKWVEERLQKPNNIALYFEWREGSFFPSINKNEGEDAKSLYSLIESAQRYREALHKIIVLYYDHVAESASLLKTFPPNQSYLGDDEVVISNRSINNKSISVKSEKEPPPPPTHPPTTPHPPFDPPTYGPPSHGKDPGDDKEKPPIGSDGDDHGIGGGDEHAPPSLGRRPMTGSQWEDFAQYSVNLRQYINKIISFLKNHRSLYKHTEDNKKQVLNSIDKINNLNYYISNVELFQNEFFFRDYTLPLSEYNEEGKNHDLIDRITPNGVIQDANYKPIAERTHIEHIIDRGARFNYTAYDNGILEYIKKKGLNTIEENAITPAFILKESIPSIDITKNNSLIEFSFSTYIKINKRGNYGCVELWNINGVCIGYYTEGVYYDAKEKKTIEDKGTLHFASYGELVEYPNSPLNPTPVPKAKEGSIIHTRIYDDFYSFPAPHNHYIHVMVLVKCRINRFSSANGGCEYDTMQDIYIDYKKVPIEKYTKKTNINYNYFHKQPEVDSIFKLFAPPFIPQHPPRYKVTWAGKVGEARYRIEDKSYHGWSSFNVSLSHTMLFTNYLTMEERLYLQEFGKYPNNNILKEEQINDFISIEENNTNTIKQGDFLGFALETPEEDKNSIFSSYKGKKISANEGDFFLQHLNRSPFKAGVLYKWEYIGDDSQQNKKYKWVELLPYWKYPNEYFIAFKEFDTLMSLLPKEMIKSFLMSSFLVANILFSDQLISNKGVFRNDIIAPNLPTSDPEIKGAFYINLDDNKLYISKGKKPKGKAD